ncbi:hypothetical protein [Compostimonas suwonensis]|uniref:Uncharacterized protein n=1 Tax=Compostimonas suwonensis TaxID=1048394 RepID=A0A2M9BZ18_9MICO|nr:hypothetical protein [Compostimonas suwonensis]PJJ63323.1 hypothetical protein CLV54_0987 [Compostimonas suwonensis]
MFIDRNSRPTDIPEPPTPDDVARAFAVPLLTLIEQDSLEEASIGTTSQTQTVTRTQERRLVMASATISYTLWRNPADRDDPANLAELSETMRASLDREPERPLPEWMHRTRERMRYPSLWEAVRTTHIIDASAVAWYTPVNALVEHVNYVVMNTFREERVRGRLPGELLGRVTEKAVEHGIPISIDGTDVPGMRIDTDPHVLGLGADLGDRILSVVIARDSLPFVDLALTTRRAPAHD